MLSDLFLKMLATLVRLIGRMTWTSPVAAETIVRH